MSQKPTIISCTPIKSVPTNIITGFLGVGKTSAILQLLNNKPKHERWAVLVNEFGEIGIDGALFEGQHSKQQGVYIREVPGGCMCCSAGLPMRVALAQLLRSAKPDRLLIEPTGLGHPKEVLQTLKDENFRHVITIQNIVTLVDARQISDCRYTEHETFQQQVFIADVIAANKQDLYSEDDKVALETYLKGNVSHDVTLVFTEQGLIDHSLLVGSKAKTTDRFVDGSIPRTLMPSAEHSSLSFTIAIPECGFIKAVNQGEGFVSIGWRFAERFVFDRNSLFALLSGIHTERLKATFITNEGCFAYNLTSDALTEISLEMLDESRIEIIARELNANWEAAIFNCLGHGQLQY